VRAAIIDDNGVVSVGTVAAPTVDADQVLVRVRTVGVNHLDLNAMRGAGPGTAGLRRTFGIDPSGDIVDQGPLVGGDRVGQRVVVKPAISCGDCAHCRSHNEADCPNQQILGIHRDGGAAEYVVVPSRNALEIPPSLDYADATVAVHSIPIALHALEAGGRVDSGDRVLVTGASGAVGRAVAQIAISRGARVVVAALRQPRVAGAVDHVTFADPEHLGDQLSAKHPEGFDLFVDATGHGHVIAAGVGALSWGGRAVILSASASPDLPLDARLFYMRRLTLFGVGAATYEEVERGLAMVAAGTVDAAVGERFDLEHIAEAIEHFRAGPHPGKTVVNVH